MASAAERMRRMNDRRRETGMVQVSGWIHGHQAAECSLLLRRLKDDKDLGVGSPRRISNGKLEKL